MAGRFLWLAPGLALCTVGCSSSGGNLGNGSQAGDDVAPFAGQAGGAGTAGVAVAGAAGVAVAGAAGAPVAGAAGAPIAGAPVAGTAGAPLAGAAGEPVAGAAGEPVAGAAGGTGDCASQSLQLDGMMYSPGGNVLPRGCEPFDATTNNPYAVRCVDAWSWYATQFPGDDYCILPPEPGMGVQYGVHPQGEQWYAQVSTGDMSGYANPPDSFVMQAGEEEEANYITGSGNTETHNWYRNAVRMRAGSHHMIVSGADAAVQRGVWGPGAPVGLFGGVGLPGAQRPDDNVPKTLEKPSEDEGLYKRLPANQDVTFNMHHFNSTDGPILKEAWTNLWWEDDARTEVFGIFGMPLTQAIDTFAQPGQTVDKHYAWNIQQDVRLLTVFGHRHAWTTNFSAWVVKPGGEEQIIYQSFDWFDEPTYRYDTQSQNPAPAPDLLVDGGVSGILTLNAGDQLHFNCHLQFNDARAAEVDSPVTPAQVGTLRFANQAFNGEMCILFGSTAAVELPQPSASSSPLPSFATMP